MRLTSIRRRRRRRRRWRQRPEIFRRRWSVATPVGLHPSYVATDHRRFLTTNPGGTPLIIRGKLFRQPRPALWQPPPLSQHPDVLVGEGALAGGDDTFLIQYRGDLLIHQALSVELYNAVAKIVEIGVVVVVAVNAPQHSVFAHSACLPDDLDPYLTSGSLLIEQHFLDD